MTPEAKKLWDSRAGTSLMMVLCGYKQPDAGDRETIEALKKAEPATRPETTPDLTRQA